MRNLLKDLYELDSQVKKSKIVKVAINKGGLKRELEVPYQADPDGEYRDDVRVYVIKGRAETLKAIDKLLVAADYCSKVGHSMTLKLGADGDGSFNMSLEYPKFGKGQVFDDGETAKLEDSEMSFGI